MHCAVLYNNSEINPSSLPHISRRGPESWYLSPEIFGADDWLINVTSNKPDCFIVSSFSGVLHFWHKSVSMFTVSVFRESILSMIKVLLYYIMNRRFSKVSLTDIGYFVHKVRGLRTSFSIFGWAVSNRPRLIVIRVWELWDGFFEFSEQCTSMWRLKNSRVEWALELSLREAGDCWKVWWRWWPLHWSWSGQEEVCQLCVRPVFALAANILPLTFLLLTVPPPPSKITPAHSRHNIMIYIRGRLN